MPFVQSTRLPDRNLFVRLMGLSGIAGAEVHSRGPAETARKSDVAVSAKARELRAQRGGLNGALKSLDKGMVGGLGRAPASRIHSMRAGRLRR